jgi:hypothetical protein
MSKPIHITQLLWKVNERNHITVQRAMGDALVHVSNKKYLWTLNYVHLFQSHTEFSVLLLPCTRHVDYSGAYSVDSQQDGVW